VRWGIDSEAMTPLRCEGEVNTWSVYVVIGVFSIRAVPVCASRSMLILLAVLPGIDIRFAVK
jgi:hypothetical protein